MVGKNVYPGRLWSILWGPNWLSKSSGRSLKRLLMMAHGEKGCVRFWDPLSHLTNSDGNFALILLNTAIPFRAQELQALWEKARFKTVTDGALNKLHQMNQSSGLDLIPDFVSGDFDSVEPEIKSLFEKKGSEIISTPDQDATDFTKNLAITVKKVTENGLGVKAIYVILRMEGRLDHMLASINTLFHHEIEEKCNIPVYLYTNDSISWLLDKGHHRIAVSSGREGDWCGLIPVGHPAMCTTTGLRWNLTKQTMHFGGIVSTSNKLAGEPEVTVETDAPLLWTMGLTT